MQGKIRQGFGVSPRLYHRHVEGAERFSLSWKAEWNPQEDTKWFFFSVGVALLHQASFKIEKDQANERAQLWPPSPHASPIQLPSEDLVLWTELIIDPTSNYLTTRSLRMSPIFYFLQKKKAMKIILPGCYG